MMDDVLLSCMTVWISQVYGLKFVFTVHRLGGRRTFTCLNPRMQTGQYHSLQSNIVTVSHSGVAAQVKTPISQRSSSLRLA